MKFAMGAETLSTLTKQTSSSSDDLGTCVRGLAQAGDPVQNDFQGAGKAAFLEFHKNADEIARGLNPALSSVLQGIGGMDSSFINGEQQQASETRSLMASANFESARFSSGR
jgi:uncharacterized protein YukE